MRKKSFIIMLFPLVLLFSGCAPYGSESTLLHTCRPVNENCLKNKEKFFSQPQIRAIESWRGHHINELISEWGYPDKVENDFDDDSVKRYIWIEEYVVSGDSRFGYSWFWYDWRYGRDTYERRSCKTYMLVDQKGIITPAWVDKFVTCTQFFNPRPSAPTA
jgi:hypothetical protein